MLGQQLSVLLKSSICGRERRSRETAKTAWRWNHSQQPWHRQTLVVGGVAEGAGSPEQSLCTAHSTKVLPVQHPAVWARVNCLMCVTGAFQGDCVEGSKTLVWGWHMTYSWSTLFLSSSWRVSRTPCERLWRHWTSKFSCLNPACPDSCRPGGTVGVLMEHNPMMKSQMVLQFLQCSSRDPLSTWRNSNQYFSSWGLISEMSSQNP